MRVAESEIKMYLIWENNEFIAAKLYGRGFERDTFSEISMQLNRENVATTHPASFIHRGEIFVADRRFEASRLLRLCGFRKKIIR